LGRLELDRETIQELMESEAEVAAGGVRTGCGSHHVCPTKRCVSRDPAACLPPPPPPPRTVV
jgi:hypothetical protein